MTAPPVCEHMMIGQVLSGKMVCRDCLQEFELMPSHEVARLRLERDSAREQFDRHVEWASESETRLIAALSDLLAVIAADDLIDESVSYMRQARAALTTAQDKP